MSRSWQHGSTSRWRKMRQIILARDPHCQLRLQGCTDRSDTVDHILAKSRGGSDEPSNLQGACQHCNLLKGDGSHERNAAWSALTQWDGWEEE